MKKKNNIGKCFRSKSTFYSEDTIFMKDTIYQLIDIIYEEVFTLYIFKNGLIYGDYDKEFKERFIMTEDERIRNLNKILYEE